MANFLLSNSPDIYVNIDADFFYNFYSDDETQTNDNLIIDNKNNFYKCIELRIDSRVKYDKRIKKYFNNSSIDDFSILNNKNLNKDTLFYFNHTHSTESNLVNLNYDSPNEELKKIDKYYNISSQRFQLAKNFLSSNKKINVKSDFVKDLKSLNYFNEYFTDKNLNDYSFYDSNIKVKNKDNFDEISDISPYGRFNVYKKKSVYSLKDIENYYVCVGFLVEKYLFSKEKKSYSLKTTYFKNNYQNNNISSLNNSLQEYTIDYSTVIKDNAVKYGETYKYVVYPVYLTNMPTMFDYHTFDEFIVCGHPYITEDIVCKEKVRPIPPAQINFKYIENKKHLKVSWSKPLEEQGDVKGYQIFKRHSLHDPFVLVKQLEFHSKNDAYERNKNVSLSIVEQMLKENNTIYFDKSFKKEKTQIYSICSIDAHGFVSNYSAQYAVRYNQYTKKCEIDLISSAGAPLHMPNLLLPRKTKFYENEDYIVNNMPLEENVKKFTLYVTPEYNKLEAGTSYYKSVLGDNYKLSIFKLENSSVHTENIKILNFNDENFI